MFFLLVFIKGKWEGAGSEIGFGLGSLFSFSVVLLHGKRNWEFNYFELCF